MRVGSFVSSAALVGALLASSALVTKAQAQKGTALSPATTWAVNKVDNNTAPYCALARKYTRNTVLTFARNLDSETSLALDFQQSLFQGAKSVSIVLDPGAGQQRSFEVSPVSDRAFVVKFGRDDSFFNALIRTGSLRVEAAGRSYHFNIADIDAGQLKLDMCVASMIRPAAGEDEAVNTASSNTENSESAQQTGSASQRQEINTLRHRIAGLKEENVSLKTRIEMQEGGIVETSKSVSQLAETIRDLKDQNAELQQELVLAQEEAAHSRSARISADETNAKIAELQSENRRLQAEIQMEAHQGASSWPQEKLTALEAENQSLQIRNEALKSTIDTTVAAQEDAEAVLKDLRAQVAALKAENRSLNIRNVELVSAAGDQGNSENIIRRLEKEIAALNFQNESLKTDAEAARQNLLDGFGQKIAALNSQNAALRADKMALQQELSSGADVDDVRNDLQTALNENAKLLQQVKEKEQALNGLSHEMAALRTRPDLSGEVEKLRAIIADLQRQAEEPVAAYEDGSDEASVSKTGEPVSMAGTGERDTTPLALAAKPERKPPEKLQSAAVYRAEEEAERKSAQKDAVPHAREGGAEVAVAERKETQKENIQKNIQGNIRGNIRENISQSPQYKDGPMNQAQAQEEIMKKNMRNAAAFSNASEHPPSSIAVLDPSIKPEEEPAKEDNRGDLVLSQKTDPFEGMDVEDRQETKDMEGAAEAVAKPVDVEKVRLQPVVNRGDVLENVHLSGEAFSLKGLITQITMSAPDEIERVENRPENIAVAYQWNGGDVYGSAEQRPISSPGEFDDLVRDYLERTQSRCPGDFAIVPDNTVDGVSLRADSYEVACVGSNVSSGASLLFFNRGGLFTVVAHEAPAKKLGSAISFRDKAMRIITEAAS